VPKGEGRWQVILVKAENPPDTGGWKGLSVRKKRRYSNHHRGGIIDKEMLKDQSCRHDAKGTSRRTRLRGGPDFSKKDQTTQPVQLFQLQQGNVLENLTIKTKLRKVSMPTNRRKVWLDPSHAGKKRYKIPKT